MTTPFYPPISRLIDASAIPGDFQDFEDLAQDGIDLILGKVFYKDLVTDVSADGVTRYYSLTILTRELKLPLLGSGMNLVFFYGTTIGFSEFPIIFDWRWEVYKHISRLAEGGFSALPEAFVDILLELADIEDRNAFIGQIVRVFLNDGSNAYQDFITNLIARIGDYDDGGNAGITTEIDNITTQLGIILDEVDSLLSNTNLYSIGYLYENYQDNDTLQAAVTSIQASINTLSEDFQLDIDLLGDFIQSALGSLSDLDEKFDRLAQLFQSWFDGITKQDFYDLVVPQFSLSLENINAALEFPRNWLLPVVEDPVGSGNWVENPDTNKMAALVFTIGKLKVSTKKGFEFENQSSFSFERAMIGKTGILLQFSGLKVDMSKAYNIPEAEVDGRPEDFMGMYAESASVTLPAKWFKEPDGTNAEIYGEKLLIGTGGLSGKIGLRALGGDNMFWVKLGESSGFELGFSSFDITFKQNKVESSNISGAMKIARFVYPEGHANAGQPVEIGVTGHIQDDGDFNLTASTDPPFPIELENVFVYHIRSLELGRDDDKFYIGTSGKLEFQGFLKDTLKLGPIDVEKLRIYSDGSIEIEGGSIHLVEPIVLPLGPVEITVTAIHYGSHQKEVSGVMRKFNYFGFDGGISVDPLGIEVRGDGVKYYYCTDDLPNKPSPYLHIQTLYLDLTIPASSPAVIFNGWLSIPEPGTSPEYAGGIKLQIPQAKIAGSVDMKLIPRYPAFIVDASIDLPAPIPLGPVAIYGFRGLIGYRYVAEKEAIGLQSGVHSWYDYYKYPPRGIHVTKFSGPDRTKTSGTPFSLGAGASLGTSPDNGTVLNIKAMVLLSIPSLFMIDGRAAVLSARLGLEDAKEPPFFAFIAVGDNSLEFGFGADFKMPTSSGDIVTLFAEVQAAFFFNDSTKWYVNFGTKTNPTTAKIIRILTIKSYLMLSAKGIEAGARGELSFSRTYGPIKVKAWAYIELGGKISFERPQFGAYMAAGVGADIDFKIVSLYATFDVLFGVEGAKPFKIYGEFRVCVKIRICWFFSFKFCDDLAVVWEFNSTVDRTPVNPMLNASSATPIGKLVKGVNMLSNETFDLAFLGSNIPANLPADVMQKVVPLDTYIDLKSEKGLIPNVVSAIIGGVTNPPQRYEDLVPPQKIIRGKEVRQVKHQYSAMSVEIKSWNPSTHSWQDYHPWKALYPSDPALDTLRAGQFQKADGQYNTIRLLATSPFSYTEQGMPGWYIPEQNGLTPGMLFCQGQARVPRCANFLEKPLGHRYFCPDDNSLFYSNQVAFLLLDHRPSGFAEIVLDPNLFGFTRSLRIQNTHRLQMRLPDPSVHVTLLMSTHAQRVRVNYFASLQDDDAMQVGYGNPDPGAADHLAPHSVVVSRSALNQPLVYDQPTWLPVTRIEVEPITASEAQITALENQIAAIEHENNLIALKLKGGRFQDTRALEAEVEKLRSDACDPRSMLTEGVTTRPQATFVNQYSRPDLTLGSAAIFTESTKTYTYAVGDTGKSAVVLKTALGGETEWCMQLDISSSPLRFYEIVQLDGKNCLRYVISAYDGKRFFLVCIDTEGREQWSKTISTLDADPHALVLPTPARDGFYFIYSDKNERDTRLMPKVLRFAFDGTVLISRQLETPGTLHQGFVVSTAGVHAQGLTVAGRLVAAKRLNSTSTTRKEGISLRRLPLGGVTVGIAVDLRDDLQPTAAWCYDNMTIHSIAVFGPGKYVLSAYHSDVNGIVLISRGLSRIDSFHEVPDTRNMQSVLCTGSVSCSGADGFYLSTHDKTLGKVSRFDWKFNAIWTKGLRLEENDLGVRAISYNERESLLSFTTLNVQLLGVSGPDLDTCITAEKRTIILKQHALKTGSLVVEAKLFKVGLTQTRGKWRAIRPHRVVVCAPRDPTNSQCNTLLHQLCWLSLEDYQYNIYIPGQPAIQEDTQATISGLTGYIQPIWRPDTSYAVRIALKDVVDDNPAAAGNFSYAFGFTTGGPVGYFHTHPNAHYGDPNHPDQSPLTSLRQYIDYGRSYPNADGNLLGAKPLFYDSEVTKIDLFFQKAWARHFFHEWPAYNGQPAAAGRIKIVIKDPTEGTSIVNPPYLDYDPADTIHVNTPQTVESWQDDTDPVVPPVYQQYQHLLESQTCVLYGGLTIKPKSEYTQVFPKHLKPSKLYTVLVNNLYDVNKDGNFDALSETREVHKFTFQTSRYKDFVAQINSYLLSDGEGASLVTRPAVFSVRKALTPVEVVAAYANVVGSANTLADGLAARYQHRFDRLIEGIFALSPLDVAQTTEFNLIRNTNDSDKIVAVLIRNPEPFNNPRMPLEDVQDTVTVLDDAGNPAPGYRVLFSKDYSQVIVMNNSLEITGPWNVRFQYKLWDGSAYRVPGVPEYSTDLVGSVVVSGLDLASF
ncbi:MAG TPA: hypothetical protein VJ183_09850 [Chloroflexia bacterium]|nr:hypothetical protein [Chloroflexia bacterium]